MGQSSWHLITRGVRTLAAVVCVWAAPARAQCPQGGWSQPVMGWDLAVGSGIRVIGPDGPMFFSWTPCGSGIQPVLQLKGPRPYGRTATSGCYYMLEMPYRNAGTKPTPVLALYVSATATYTWGGSASIHNASERVTRSLAPGEVALIRGRVTAFSGPVQLSGSVDDVNGGGNFHPPDPMLGNNTGHVSITVPEGC